MTLQRDMRSTPAQGAGCLRSYLSDIMPRLLVQYLYY